MSNFHTIRLHGPWQADFFTPSSADPAPIQEPQRLKLPSDRLPRSSVAGAFTIVLERAFNWPHATPTQPVFLHVDSNVDWRIQVNERPVITFKSDRATSIGEFLQPRNIVRLTATLPGSDDGQIIREVSLKIA